MAGVWKDNPNLANEMVRLWNAGRSAGEIATILGHGLTGNAVIGCANRLRKNGVAVINKPTGPAPDRSMVSKPKTAPRLPAAPKRPAAETAAIKLKIRELRTEKNMPAAEIAEQVGLTKAQVGGYLSAMGLGAFKSPSPDRGTARRGAPNAALPKMTEAAVEPLNLDMMALTSATCRWPYGEANIVFCGHPVAGRGPFCPGHAGIGYQPKHGSGGAGNGMAVNPGRRHSLEEGDDHAAHAGVYWAARP